MNKSELINKSFVGIVTHISSDTKLESLEQYINTNKEIFDNYKGIIVAANYAFDALIERHHAVWLKYYDDVKFIDLDKNRGHSFGTLDLDGAVFDYCKENDIEWLFKVNDDQLYTPEFLLRRNYLRLISIIGMASEWVEWKNMSMITIE
tara:strand:+ start:220 stop:666 length:447 start_codon:yes stop_codon:yes gene_type:complete